MKTKKDAAYSSHLTKGQEKLKELTKNEGPEEGQKGVKQQLALFINDLEELLAAPVHQTDAALPASAHSMSFFVFLSYCGESWNNSRCHRLRILQLT